MHKAENIIFGPVPSRRLGRSLGINNIPPKECTYSCVYCQVGKTLKMSIQRKEFYSPETVYNLTKKKIKQIKNIGEEVDYITFVPDGEPTLDINLSKHIELLKKFGIPIAIITNSSLLWLDSIKKDLSDIDLVSIKVDTTTEDQWTKINRPNAKFELDKILQGIVSFAREFNGVIISETMILKDFDSKKDCIKTAKFLKTVNNLDKAYLSVPTRPPYEKWVKIPSEITINKYYQEFCKVLGQEKVELLIGYEGDTFVSTDDVQNDILGITSVHPMREEALKKLLEKRNLGWSCIESLVHEKKLLEVQYNGHRYYIRKMERGGQ